MSRSHLPVQHFLKQAHRLRADRKRRAAWLNDFIQEVADLFDPTTSVARVGYESRLSDSGTSVSLFLGRTEVIGGPLDGSTRRPGFRFDLRALLGKFERVDQMEWTYAETSETSRHDDSLLLISGLVHGHAIQVRIQASPPPEVGTALREYPNGRFEPI